MWAQVNLSTHTCDIYDSSIDQVWEGMRTTSNKVVKSGVTDLKITEIRFEITGRI